jgi:hypothetical protein
VYGSNVRNFRGVAMALPRRNSSLASFDGSFEPNGLTRSTAFPRGWEACPVRKAATAIAMRSRREGSPRRLGTSIQPARWDTYAKVVR